MSEEERLRVLLSDAVTAAERPTSPPLDRLVHDGRRARLRRRAGGGTALIAAAAGLAAVVVSTAAVLPRPLGVADPASRQTPTPTSTLVPPPPRVPTPGDPAGCGQNGSGPCRGPKTVSTAVTAAEQAFVPELVQIGLNIPDVAGYQATGPDRMELHAGFLVTHLDTRRFGVVLLRIGAPGPTSCAGFQAGPCTEPPSRPGTRLVVVHDGTASVSAYYTRADGTVVQVTALNRSDPERGVFWQNAPPLTQAPVTAAQAVELATSVT